MSELGLPSDQGERYVMLGLNIPCTLFRNLAQEPPYHKLQQGSAHEGFNLLRNAVEEGAAAAWPARAEAEADLGLAYLMIGDEASGRRWLQRPQQGFEASGQ
jgi:hypothetical protein